MLELLFVVFMFVFLEKLYKVTMKYIEETVIVTERKEDLTVIDKREFFISKNIKKYVIYLSCLDEELGKPLSVSKKEYESIEIGSRKRVKVRTLLYEDEIFVKYKSIKEKHKKKK